MVGWWSSGPVGFSQCNPPPLCLAEPAEPPCLFSQLPQQSKAPAPSLGKALPWEMLVAQRPVFKLPKTKQRIPPLAHLRAPGKPRAEGLQATAADAPAPEKGKDKGGREKGPEKSESRD